MRILYLCNNFLGYQVLEWLEAQGEEIVGLVVHPTHRQQYGPDIVAASRLDHEYIFDGSQLQQPETLEAIATLKPELGLSVLFGYILREQFLSLLPLGCINLHPALLPYNRGAHPNVWSIIDETPAGATLHFIDAGIDTGDIIAQRQVEIEPLDTGGTLYHKLEEAGLALFIETWPMIKSGQIQRVPQRSSDGTSHHTRDAEEIDRIDLRQQYEARHLINILRARTFPPYRSAYFEEDGRRVYLRLQLSYEDDL